MLSPVTTTGQTALPLLARFRSENAHRGDLNAALQFLNRRIEEEAARSGEALSCEERFLLEHLPSTSVFPQPYVAGTDSPLLPLPRDRVYERRCKLAKAAYHHDLRDNLDKSWLVRFVEHRVADPPRNPWLPAGGNGKLPMNDNEQACEARIIFDNDLATTETLLVTPIGQNLYRMEESSALGEVSYHDIIETEPQDNGSLRFLRVNIRSELKTTSWVISRSLAESSNLSTLLDRIIAVGGHWERIFGGWLIVHLPPAENDAPDLRVQQVL